MKATRGAGCCKLLCHPSTCALRSSHCSSTIRRVQACLQVKKGPLAETSPMLNDISAVPSWAKVTSLAVH